MGAAARPVRDAADPAGGTGSAESVLLQPRDRRARAAAVPRRLAAEPQAGALAAVRDWSAAVLRHAELRVQHGLPLRAARAVPRAALAACLGPARDCDAAIGMGGRPGRRVLGGRQHGALRGVRARERIVSHDRASRSSRAGASPRWCSTRAARCSRRPCTCTSPRGTRRRAAASSISTSAISSRRWSAIARLPGRASTSTWRGCRPTSTGTRNGGASYDYFLVKASFDVSQEIFKERRGAVELVARSGWWWLYRNVEREAAVRSPSQR